METGASVGVPCGEWMLEASTRDLLRVKVHAGFHTVVLHRVLDAQLGRVDFTNDSIHGQIPCGR